MPNKIIDLSKWAEFLDENTGDTADLDGTDHYDRGFADGLGVADMWIDAQPMPPKTKREWLLNLSTVELVNWIKNTASAMSYAELLKWMEEENNG